jgi:hypothetical protein
MCPKAKPNEIKGYNFEEAPRWTFPDDPNEKAGWGPFNFNWLFGKAKGVIKWHDNITKRGSFAQKISIPNSVIAKHWRRMLKYRDAQLRAEGDVSPIRSKLWKWSGSVMKRVQRFFYEGPL